MDNPRDPSLSARQGGMGNTQNITVNNYIGGDSGHQLLQEISTATGSRNYSVLVCAPPVQNVSKTTSELFSLISDKVKENDIELIIGGGMSLIPDGRGYPHLNEHDIIVDRKCNAVIIFAEDYSTFIQLSHLSIIKNDLQTLSIELFCFYDGGGVAESDFMKAGPIAFFTDAAKGYLYDTANIGDELDAIVDEVVKSILRHKALRSSR